MSRRDRLSAAERHLPVTAATGLLMLAGAMFAPAADAACSAPVQSAANMVVRCTAINAEQTFVVPTGVSSVRVVAVGASGGHGDLGAALGGVGGAGGVGAVVSGDLRVTAGSTLYVIVGGTGGQGGPSRAGGFNGGGGSLLAPNSSAGGGGGGASDVRSCSSLASVCDTLASRLLVAAGGGGGGGGAYSNDFSEGGAGGAGGTAGAGGDGKSPTYDTFTTPAGGGAGATATAGGMGGGTNAGAGSIGAGGQAAGAQAAGSLGSAAGGGGGGGLFGGGGGGASNSDGASGAGGGGGSSLGPAGSTFSSAAVSAFGVAVPASVTIAYARPAPAAAPSVVVTHPTVGQVIRRFSGRGNARKRRRLVIAGRASDPTGVPAVALTIERLPRSTGSPRVCTWLNQTKGLERRSCHRPPLLFATVTANGSWTYRTSRRIKLAPGRYRVTAYGQGKTGVFGNVAARPARVITFQLSRR
jgi:hypothetical protein